MSYAYRLDIAGLPREDISVLKDRINMVAFLAKDDPEGRFVDVFLEHDIEHSRILDGLNVRYIDYSHVPARLWTYPFA